MLWSPFLSWTPTPTPHRKSWIRPRSDVSFAPLLHDKNTKFNVQLNGRHGEVFISCDVFPAFQLRHHHVSIISRRNHEDVEILSKIDEI